MRNKRLTAGLSGSLMSPSLRVRNMTGLEPPLLEEETGGLQQTSSHRQLPPYPRGSPVHVKHGGVAVAVVRVDYRPQAFAEVSDGEVLGSAVKPRSLCHALSGTTHP